MFSIKSASAKKEQTRQLIIEKAASLFNKKGIAGTSLSDLTKATGLTKGSIYGNFRNKDAVAIKVYRYNLRFTVEALKAEMALYQSDFEKLKAIPLCFRKIYKQVQNRGGCPILNTAVEADDTHPELKNIVMETISAWKRSIVDLITQAKANGEILPDTKESEVAELLIVLLEGSGALAKVTGQDSYVLSALTQIDLILDSLRIN